MVKKKVASVKKAPSKKMSSQHNLKAIKHVNVLSVALVFCMMLAILAFVSGVINTVITTIDGSVPFGQSLLFILKEVIANAVLGFVFGAVGTWLYNGIARKIVSIKVVIE